MDATITPRMLPPICGGSDDDPPASLPPADPPAPPEPPAEPPAPPDPAARLAEEVAELRAELRARPASPAPPAPAPRAPTAEEIEAAYTSGRITLEQRDAAIDDLRFQQRYTRQREQERVQEAEARAEADLTALVTRHPELGQRGSAMLREVEARLRVLGARGHDTTKLATQLDAAEYVVNERAARTRPTPPPVPVSSGPGSFAGGPPSGTGPKDEFADIPQDVRNYWTRTGMQKERWPALADAYRQGQTRRAARVQSILGRAG